MNLVIQYASEEELTIKLRALLAAREEWLPIPIIAERYNLNPVSVTARIRRWLQQGVLAPELDIDAAKQNGRVRRIRVTPSLRRQFSRMRRYKARKTA